MSNSCTVCMVIEKNAEDLVSKPLAFALPSCLQIQSIIVTFLRDCRCFEPGGSVM